MKRHSRKWLGLLAALSAAAGVTACIVELLGPIAVCPPDWQTQDVLFLSDQWEKSGKLLVMDSGDFIETEIRSDVGEALPTPPTAASSLGFLTRNGTLFLGTLTRRCKTTANGWKCRESGGVVLVIRLRRCAFLFLGVAGALMLIRGRRSYGPQECSHCGYSLRGLVSNRCPECGTPFVGKNDHA